MAAAGTDAPAAGWGVVVPVKLLTRAKTRLQAYGDAGRGELALAFAADVLAAAHACPLVSYLLVVTDDPRAARELAGPGVHVAPDQPAAGLNAALEHGEDLLRRRAPGLGTAALAADLPALRADDLAAALAAVRGRSLVADAAGTGTTMLAVPAGGALRPSYGPGSAQRHRSRGARDLPAAAGLRRDVDTPDDLREALRLGVGPHTARACAQLCLLT